MYEVALGTLSALTDNLPLQLARLPDIECLVQLLLSEVLINKRVAFLCVVQQFNKNRMEESRERCWKCGEVEWDDC